MPISRIKIHSNTDGRDLILDLNVIQQGWVAQLIEGTFGETTSYSFTDGNLTSVESSTIDINVRLTPVVTFTERTPESIISFLGSAARNAIVTLTDTDIPGFSIGYQVVGEVATAELSERPTSEWTQDCVIREIKYSYSENPAKIEFTISTKKPFLTGPTLDFYYGIRNTSSNDLTRQFHKIYNRLRELDVHGDIEGLALSFPKVPKGRAWTIDSPNFPYKIYVQNEDPNKNAEAWLTKSSSGYKNFDFRGGANSVTSYAYITEAYPMFSIDKVKQILDTYGTFGGQVSTYYGMTRAWVRFVQVKRGL